MYYVLLFSFEHQKVKFRHPIFWASQIRNYRSYIFEDIFFEYPVKNFLTCSEQANSALWNLAIAF